MKRILHGCLLASGRHDVGHSPCALAADAKATAPEGPQTAGVPEKASWLPRQ